MPKKLYLGFLFIFAAIISFAGCKQKPASQPGPQAPTQAAASAGYFQTSFQSESQFIVEAIVSDLAEQIYYAANHRLPDKKIFSVTATEKSGSPKDSPAYQLLINLDPNQTDLKFTVSVNGPIWSASVYSDLAATLAQTVKLNIASLKPSEDTALLSELLDGTAETIERQNEALSGSLEKDFSNPLFHEQAALLLGAFLLRDHSGRFYEIRSPLSRMTAHLAMARLLGSTNGYGINGRLAEAMMLTLAWDQAPALAQLKRIDSKDTAVGAMIRTLQMLNTGNFRLLPEGSWRSGMESSAWYYTLADYVNGPIAWTKLSDEQKQTIDFIRIANSLNASVEMGHTLLQESIPLEMQEIKSVYELTHKNKFGPSILIAALNETPERCFGTGKAQATRVQIIGWGQWASFFQRHLCQAVTENFDFMERMWGVHDDAKEFAAQCEKQFGALRLYPFVRRFNCTDIESYHKSVDDGFKVTVATPHLVPAMCWNYLCYHPSFAPLYEPNPNPHVNEWHDHNPPPGTVYNLGPRLDHPSLSERGDVLKRLEQLHEWAPYDCRIIRCIIEKKYTNNPTYDQAMGLYGPLMSYSVSAMRAMAGILHEKPEQYEKLMLQAAEFEPACYYELSDYALKRKQEEKAMRYMDKACEMDPDAVGVASHAEWRVNYALSKGQIDKARKIAEFAGEVYSFAGLTAKAAFLESTSNYNGAFEWFAKIEERYDDSIPLISFCQRYKSATRDARFDPEAKKRVQAIFPQGMEKASLADFHSAPTNGAMFTQQNDLLLSAGLKKGDIVVAINHVHVRSLMQYGYVRDFQSPPTLDLIVWQGDAFHEIKSTPPNRRFGVLMANYPKTKEE